jgi:hypothetical protein
MDTSGFYKKVSDNEWWFAPNFVHHKDYTLKREGNRESIDGWEWHDKAPNEYKLWEYEQQNNEEAL